MQLNLFETLACYGDTPLTNQELYDQVQQRLGLDPEEVNKTTPVGRSRGKVSLVKRTIRWHQQTLKNDGLIERVGPGQWRRSGKNNEYTQLVAGYCMIGYSTEWGTAIWGDAAAAADLITEPIQLYFSSPPYPLSKPRSYGNVDEKAYVAWLAGQLEPVIKRLADGGALALNLSNDIFLRNSPARSTYLERLILTLTDDFGLYKMDTIIWGSNKAPTPTAWAGQHDMQLYARYEPIIWFTNNPHVVGSSNRRMQADLGLDGLPGNIWTISNSCHENRRLNKAARGQGMPGHDATFPLALAKRAISFWTRPNDLVVDLMSGSNTVGWVAEKMQRRWITGDQNRESVMMGALRWP